MTSHALPLLGDYSEWTYHGVLLRDWLQGHLDQGYVLKNYPVPNSLTTVGLGLLMLIMPWKLATKTWLIVEVVLGLFSADQLQRAAGRPQVWRSILMVPAVLLGTAFWFGFENFMFGTYFAMLLCALLFRAVESKWMYGALLTFAFFSHMIPYGFALLVLLLFSAQQGRWRLLLQAVPSGLLCVWYGIGRLTHANADAKAGMESSVAYLTPAFAAFKVNTYLKCWGFVNPASSSTDSVLLRLVGTKLFVVLFALDIVVAIGLAWLLSIAFWRSLRHNEDLRYFWIAVGIFVVVALAMPGAAAGISDPGGRMMQVALWCAVCVIGIRRRWPQLVLGACAVTLLVANGYLFEVVALKPPRIGATTGPLPDRVRQFAHVYYSGRVQYLDEIDTGKRDLKIFPTAMFLQKEEHR